ncbi:MAG: hypothetical protein JWL77_2115 [Chthonomonadaceae bacterium]|nr:hypothetical protein [Chthonomonadaceae bacterium]
MQHVGLRVQKRQIHFAGFRLCMLNLKVGNPFHSLTRTKPVAWTGPKSAEREAMARSRVLIMRGKHTQFAAPGTLSVKRLKEVI